MTRLAAVASLLVVAAAFAADTPRPQSEWDDGYFGRATPGDSILYTDDQGNPVLKAEVIRVDRPNRKVMLVKTTYSQKPGVGNATTTETFAFTAENPAPAAGVKVTAREDTVKLANGTQLVCTLRETVRTEGAMKGKVVEKAWYSAAVPFDQLVRRESADGVMVLNTAVYQKAPR